jgi:uncharacterized membrane protein YccC
MNTQNNEMTHEATGAVFHGVVLAVLCVISYWLITHILAHAFSVSRDDDFLGGMWAVVAAVFVYRYGYEQTVAAAFSRMAPTLSSFVLCFLYLLAFPFDVWGMAALIGIGAVMMVWLGRPDHVITTGITTAVVMVVAAVKLLCVHWGLLHFQFRTSGRSCPYFWMYCLCSTSLSLSCCLR